MIAINRLRQNPQELAKKWQERGLEVNTEELLTMDKQWRSHITEIEQLKQERNSASQKIGALKKSGEDTKVAMEKVRKIGDEIQSLEKKVNYLKNSLDNKLLSLPNIHSSKTPVGLTEEDNIEIRAWGEKPQYDFTPQPHWDLGEKLNILDMPRGAKISGSGFMLSRGSAARLERALLNWFLDQHQEQGYQEYVTPFIVNRKTMTGTGQLPKFENDLYCIEDGDYFLIPTAEVPLTNIYAQEILEQKTLPYYLTGYTPCFRREAGAAGRDTRGILRMHQFNKVEMVKLVEPEQSYMELELLVSDAENLLQRLGLHYRVLELCSGDLGFSAARCYDLEVWSPGTNRYLEVSSCSNFEDFQARRCGLKYRKEGTKKPQLLHTLNGSGLAIPRCLVAILETYQQKDGSIKIPDVLVPYMNGQTEITLPS